MPDISLSIEEEVRRCVKESGGIPQISLIRIVIGNLNLYGLEHQVAAVVTGMIGSGKLLQDKEGNLRLP